MIWAPRLGLAVGKFAALLPTGLVTGGRSLRPPTPRCLSGLSCGEVTLWTRQVSVAHALWGVRQLAWPPPSGWPRGSALSPDTEECSSPRQMSPGANLCSNLRLLTKERDDYTSLSGRWGLCVWTRKGLAQVLATGLSAPWPKDRGNLTLLM